MCFLSTPFAPPPPAAPPALPPVPTAVDPEARRARDLARRAAAARAGYASTIRTSGLGDPSPVATTASSATASPTASAGVKALLGQ
ncbi:MAG: hypothetical protein PS018_06600 [bacterium]|nr:hypothetical protein [bacterium]